MHNYDLKLQAWEREMRIIHVYKIFRTTVHSVV